MDVFGFFNEAVSYPLTEPSLCLLLGEEGGGQLNTAEDELSESQGGQIETMLGEEQCFRKTVFVK